MLVECRNLHIKCKGDRVAVEVIIEMSSTEEAAPASKNSGKTKNRLRSVRRQQKESNRMGVSELEKRRQVATCDIPENHHGSPDSNGPVRDA